MHSEVEFVGKAVAELVARLASDSLALLVLVLGVAPYRLLRAAILHGQGRSKLQQRRGAPTAFKHVLVTGASTGIGRGLAERLAAPGVRLVLLSFRDSANLGAAAAKCRKLGADVHEVDADVSDAAAMRAAVLEAEQVAPLDLVVANAGIVPQRDGVLEAQRVLSVNVMGTVNTIVPAIEAMRPRQRGHIVMTSSLGGFSSAPTRFLVSYTASKACIRNLGEGLRFILAKDGITCTTLFPGFTESAMTQTLLDKGCNLYGLWNNDDAADYMAEGIRRGDSEVAFPFGLHMVTKVVGNLPSWLRELAMPALFFGDPFRPMDNLNL